MKPIPVLISLPAIVVLGVISQPYAKVSSMPLATALHHQGEYGSRCGFSKDMDCQTPFEPRGYLCCAVLSLGPCFGGHRGKGIPKFTFPFSLIPTVSLDSQTEGVASSDGKLGPRFHFGTQLYKHPAIPPGHDPTQTSLAMMPTMLSLRQCCGRALWAGVGHAAA